MCLNYSDAYYRYDPSAPPRGMGPPGYGAVPPVRHRAPHPLQQQQSQYPTYQPTPTDNMYSMGDQHAGMGLGDITGWGAQPPPQPYGQPMGYGHPQTPQAPQRQTQARYLFYFYFTETIFLFGLLLFQLSTTHDRLSTRS